MILVIYGKHTRKWMDAISHNNLISLLTPEVIRITNCNDINKLKVLPPICKIIPLMETHAQELHDNNIKGVMPNINIINTFSNKIKFSQFISNNNLTKYAPITYQHINEIPKNKEVIVKPHKLHSGDGMYITKNIKNDIDMSNFVIQEYIDDPIEYCTYIVASKGKIKLAITYKYTYVTTKHIKQSVNNNNNIEKVTLDQQYVDQLELFLLSCKYNGVCNIDFKICDNIIKVLEINPRLGGSLMLSSNKQDLVDIIKCMIN